jgi:spore coat protein A, manganese oxidase
MAERAEVIVDFSQYSPGTKAFLRNTLERPALSELMRFDVVKREADDAKIPSRLVEPGFLVWTINGKRFDPDRTDAKIALGEVEFWRFRNEATLRLLGRLHPAHVHLAHFQVLERNGRPPLAHERGWKDTIALEKGEEVLVMLRFEKFKGRYMLHCHNLEHEGSRNDVAF